MLYLYGHKVRMKAYYSMKFDARRLMDSKSLPLNRLKYIIISANVVSIRVNGTRTKYNPFYVQ